MKYGKNPSTIGTRKATYISFDKIASMRHEVIMVLHVSSLFDPDEMLGGIEIFSRTSAGEKLLHGHGFPYVYCCHC